ncbi:MAG: FkbM family methyltransferase [Bradyrhizobium sp.]
MYRARLTAESIRFRLRALKARFRDQRAELDFIKHHVRQNDVVCDIGANKGSFIYWLSCWCRAGKVVAFEPQPELARRLLSVCTAMKLSNVTVEGKAVYSHSGRRNLYVPTKDSPGASLIPNGSSGGEASTTVSVPVVSLDDYFCDNTRIALLKIDVEGAELHVLKGAERILRTSAPLIVFECENRHLTCGSVADTFSYLERLGYEGRFICRKKILPISKFDASLHQRQSGEWFWKSKDYCNNFIFINQGFVQRIRRM